MNNIPNGAIIMQSVSSDSYDDTIFELGNEMSRLVNLPRSIYLHEGMSDSEIGTMIRGYDDQDPTRRIQWMMYERKINMVSVTFNVDTDVIIEDINQIVTFVLNSTKH